MPLKIQHFALDLQCFGPYSILAVHDMLCRGCVSLSTRVIDNLNGEAKLLSLQLPYYIEEFDSTRHTAVGPACWPE